MSVQALDTTTVWARRYAPFLAVVLGGLPGWMAAIERLPFGHGTALAPLLHGLGDATAILGLSLFAASLVLMLRVGWLERAFGGLDSLYRAHHLVGVFSFLVLLIHPVTVGLRMLIRHGAARALETTLPNPAHAAIFLGWIALLWLMAMMIATFLARLSYVGWKWLHASAGIAFLFGVAHLLLVRRTSEFALPLLGLWIVAGVVALIWRLLIDRGAVAGRRYIVERARHLTDRIVELTLRPLGPPLAFAPGQFVFAAFCNTADYRGCAEYHPFTIASPGGDSALRLIVKALGDCTARMQDLRPGVPVRLQGPFGAFRPAAAGRPQTWIAGGIGVTPFLAMADALPAEGPPIAFYYGVPSRQEAACLDELERIAVRQPRLHLIPLFADRGEMPSIARIAADGGTLADREFFICGPVGMVGTLTQELLARGVPEASNHTERFDFR